MKYVDDFRSKRLIKKIAEKIRQVMPDREIKIMEVCGSHTMNFSRFGLKKILPQNLKFLSGPGCPVCVSDTSFIDAGIYLAKQKNITIATFGDMLKVPGNSSSLQKERANGADIRVVYSPLDALKIAHSNKDRKVIFLAVGFETTIPGIALSIKQAKEEALDNLSFLCALKLMPPAMKYLLEDRRVDISGFLCPGHVSTIIGTRPYEFIAKKYGIPCSIAGFEPLDILEGIYFILKQINENKPRVFNQYSRAVKKEGNSKAREIMREVFKPRDESWRGLGIIPASGLQIRDKFAILDAECLFPFKVKVRNGHLLKCRCGDVLKGLITPDECPLFAHACNPENAQGPCMVSSEGACNAYYKYR